MIDTGARTYAKYIILKSLMDFKRTDVVLDLGCGSGRFTRLIAGKVGQLHGIDISKRALAIASINNPANCFLKMGSALKLPYPSKFFDKIYCVDVIEHIKNDLGVLFEIRRVLKDDGEAVVYFVDVPLSEEIGHVHRYNMQSAKKIISEAGLRITGSNAYRCSLDGIISVFKKPSPKMTASPKGGVSVINKAVSMVILFESMMPALPAQGHMINVKKEL